MNKQEKFVITVNRELGSGGRTVGRKLAERLEVKYYDKALIQGLTKELGLTVEEIERIKAQKNSWWATEFNNYYTMFNATATPMVSDNVLTTATMIGTEQRILQELAAQESCVVAGRSGFLVFHEWPNHVSIFIQAPMESRIQRIMAKQGLSRKEAIATIEEVDKGRENYIKKYAELNSELSSSLKKISRYDTRNYDLVINMDGLSEDDAVEIIMSYINCTNK